jgi:hypothetical protein
LRHAARAWAEKNLDMGVYLAKFERLIAATMAGA